MGFINIAVDFDGTLCDHVFPKIGEEAPDAFRVLYRLRAMDDVRLMLWTMRSDDRKGGAKPLTEAVEWCKARNLTFWGVNSNPEQHSWTTSPKQYAHVYIDDAALGCPLIEVPGFHRPVVDWKAVAPLLFARIKQLRG